MWIADSARKHGVADEDMIHAVRNPVRFIFQREGDRVLVIGPDYSGRLLRIVVLGPDSDDPGIIHADELPPEQLHRYVRK